MDTAAFEAFHRDHQQFLARVEGLERGLAVAADDPETARDGLGEFLRYFDESIDPHLHAEDREVYPLLDRFLPAEATSAEVLRREQETLRGLIASLRRGLSRVGADPEATADVLATAGDVVLLLRDLIRKEDRVFHPLLRRLLGDDRDA